LPQNDANYFFAMPKRPKKRARVRIWREKRRLTQDYVARVSGVPRSTLQRWETLERNFAPRYDHLINVAMVLYCEPEELLEPEWRGWTGPGAAPQRRVWQFNDLPEELK
jgi:transcriptional regulator with XRE-family HTH domain